MRERRHKPSRRTGPLRSPRLASCLPPVVSVQSACVEEASREQCVCTRDRSNRGARIVRQDISCRTYVSWGTMPARVCHVDANTDPPEKMCSRFVCCCCVSLSLSLRSRAVSGANTKPVVGGCCQCFMIRCGDECVTVCVVCSNCPPPLASLLRYNSSFRISDLGRSPPTQGHVAPPCRDCLAVSFCRPTSSSGCSVLVLDNDPYTVL